MSAYLWVGLGGFIGSILRYALSLFISTHSSVRFPLATFAINVLGCFVIGIVYGLSNREFIGSDFRLFLATGLCGGFTTFSAFSAESLILLRDGDTFIALSYIISSIVFGVLATVLGMWLLRFA